MKTVRLLPRLLVAASILIAPVLFAADKMDGMHKGMNHKMNMTEFMKSCDMDHDGMMSKSEMLAHMEKMFDKIDTKKTGKLNKQQSEEFLKQFNTISGN